MCHLSLVACPLSPRTEILQDYQVSPSTAASLMTIPLVNRCQILMLGLQGVVDLWINWTIHFVVCIYAGSMFIICCLTMTKEPLALQDLQRPWWQLWWLDDHSNQYLPRNAVVYVQYYLSSFLGYSYCLLASGQEKAQLWDVSHAASRKYRSSIAAVTMITDMAMWQVNLLWYVKYLSCKLYIISFCWMWSQACQKLSLWLLRNLVHPGAWSILKCTDMCHVTSVNPGHVRAPFWYILHQTNWR